MYIVDDPALALIARFVGEPESQDASDKDFLEQQVAAIEAYVGRFPPDERETRALAWIEDNARQYRQQWQKRRAVTVLAKIRCPDCPLTGGDECTPCTIHARWLQLLGRYAASELSSRAYVEESLALLTAHKELLRVRRLPDERSLAARPDVHCCR
ncbi:hypothetical protein [Accumulibacter sp.]|uniref:hypothetical protein n=1 Tax=Accumulibacter sp. TaxID=2053492 RepID=UPI00262BE6E8|nr:hypothetical protein [Accumulibacter sp.]